LLQNFLRSNTFRSTLQAKKNTPYIEMIWCDFGKAADDHRRF